MWDKAKEVLAFAAKRPMSRLYAREAQVDSDIAYYEAQINKVKNLSFSKDKKMTLNYLETKLSQSIWFRNTGLGARYPATLDDIPEAERDERFSKQCVADKLVTIDRSRIVWAGLVSGRLKYKRIDGEIEIVSDAKSLIVDTVLYLVLSVVAVGFLFVFYYGLNKIFDSDFFNYINLGWGFYRDLEIGLMVLYSALLVVFSYIYLSIVLDWAVSTIYITNAVSVAHVRVDAASYFATFLLSFVVSVPVLVLAALSIAGYVKTIVFLFF